MIKVNIKTLTATREGLPMSLIGLSDETLMSLQTALNPVPDEFKDIEYWNEVDETPTYDSTTNTLDGTETLTVNKESKLVVVVKGTRNKTVEELAAERKASVPQTITLRQGRELIIKRGLTQIIENAIDSIEDEIQRLVIRNFWENSQVFERNNETLLQFLAMLGITEQEGDEMFIEANKL